MADQFSMRRTFPTKTTFSNNSKLKKKKWTKNQQKYNQSIFSKNDSDYNSDESELNQQQSNSIPQELNRLSSDEKIPDDEKVGFNNTEFREEIAKIPLGKAKQLRERLGKKLFDKTFFVEDSSSSLNVKSTQKRDNPKRPREVSSKKPVSKFRNVFENERLERTICDPRFDSRCGEFDDYIYRNNYSFLNEIRQREKKILMKEIKSAPDDGPVNKSKLKETLRKMKNQERTQADVNRRKEVIREIRHENNERMRQGLLPVFKTRAQIRELISRKKYDELKSGKKLEKYLRRKMKKQDKRRNGLSESGHENESLKFSND